MSSGHCVVLTDMMDGSQTKTKFEERGTESLQAYDGWISQLNRLSAAHTTTKILLTKTHTNTHTQQEYKIPLVAFGKKRKHKVSPVYDVFFWTNAIVEKRVSLLGKILQKIKVKLILVYGLGLD